MAASLLYICVPEDYETYLVNDSFSQRCTVYTVSSEGAVHSSSKENSEKNLSKAFFKKMLPAHGKRDSLL